MSAGARSDLEAAAHEGETMASEGNHQIEVIVDDLTEEFGQRIGAKQVHDEVMRVYGRFSAAPIQQFVPVLTRRIAREHLLRRT